MTQDIPLQDIRLKERNEWRKVTVRVLIGVAVGFAIPLLAYLAFGKVPRGLPKEQTESRRPVTTTPR